MPDTETETIRTESLVGDEPKLHISELSLLEIDQLRSETERLSHSNVWLKNETEMFEKYCTRLDPKELEQLPSVDEGITAMEFIQARGRRRSKSRSLSADRTHGLQMEQKCEVAQRELHETTLELERLRQQSDRLMHNLKAAMEEAELRSTEIKKAVSEFDRDVRRSVLKKKNRVVTSEKVMRYIREKARAKDMLIDKLRLKNVSMKVQKRKLQLQLKAKDESGEELHDVDFQQLKIENTQFLERIDERNQDLLRLKLTAGNTLQILTSYKKKLQRATDESSRLDKEVSLREDMLLRIEIESQQVEEERSKSETMNKKLRRQLSDYRVPPIFRYVEETSENSELERSIKAWERKVEIAEMSMKSYRKAWGQMKTANSQAQAFTQLYATQ